MKVILQHDVRDVGRAGDLVNVSAGYARNFLFPRKLAWEATETRVKEWGHLQRVAEIKRKKAMAERADLLTKISAVTVSFKMNAGKGDKIFGSVTSSDIARELQNMGFSIDRKDIHLEEPIKMLGQHKAAVKMGGKQEGQVTVLVERLDGVPVQE